VLVNVAKYLEMEVSTILSVGAAFASPADRGTESLLSRVLNKWHQPSENTYRKRHMNPCTLWALDISLYISMQGVHSKVVVQQAALCITYFGMYISTS